MPAQLTSVTLTTTGATAATGQAVLAKPVTDTFCTFAISGTYSGTIKFEVSPDGTTYYPVESQSLTDATLKTGTISPSDNTSVAYTLFGTFGYGYVRLYVVSIASGGIAVTGNSNASVGVPVLPSTSAGAVAATSVTSTGAITSSSPTAGVGYATGAGGAVTQITSRSTGVTLNTDCGAITLVSAAGSATPFSFTVTNSAVAATDTIIVSQKSGTDKYTTQVVTAVAAGSFQLTLANASGTTTEQPVFNFALIKAVAA